MRGEKIKKVSLRLLDFLPIAIPAALAAFSVVAIFFLIINDFKSAYVWSFGLLAAILVLIILWRYKTVPLGTAKERAICSVLLLVGVLAWVGFNAFHSSQHYMTNRDPGTYAVTAAWLVHHDSVRIPASQAFGEAANVNPYSAGFAPDYLHKGYINAQGAHLLPALLGLVGRVVGDGRMLHFNVLFGGIALLALYAFASRLVKPRWALIATATVALSMPLIYFSRDTYTEPLALTFTFVALALLWDAVKTGRLGLWLLAGVAAGAGTLTRIDAYLTIAAFIVFTIIYLALTPLNRRKKAINSSVAIALGMIVTSFLGWYDVSHLSTDYYNGQRHLLLPEVSLVIVLAVVGVAFVLYDWRTGLHERLNKITDNWRSVAAAGLVLLTFIILASRPLWLTERKIIGDSLQRSYAENTVGWVSWYIDPILLIAAVLGMAWLAYKAMKDRSLLLLAFLFVVGATALVYFVTPDVAPDQIWASRRFLPVVIPGFAVFGVAALAWLYNRKNIKWLLGADGKVVVTVFVTLILLGQIFVSAPIIFAREYTLRASVIDTCRALPPKSAVLWVGGASTLLVEPTKALCGVPAEGYGQIFTKTAPTRESLVEAARNATNSGYTPVIGAYSSDTQLLPPDSQLTHVGTYSSQVLDPAFTHPPRHVSTATDGIDLGWISPNGQIVSLPEPSQ